jgi:adenylate cyclase
VAEQAVSGEELAKQTRARGTRAAVLANGLGGLVVFVFLLFLLPLTPGGASAVVNGMAAAVYLAITLTVGIRYATRRNAPMWEWLAAERPPTEAERELVLGQPLFLVKVSATFWALAAVLFGLVNLGNSDALVASVVATILLGGVTTCAVGYLSTERLIRPVTARALAGTPPERPVTPGVTGRLTMAWTLATGVPILGIAAIGVAELAGADLDESTIVAATLFLAVVALVVGLLAILVAARAVAEPLSAVKDALVRVQRGDFDARVTVDDGSEVGLLQAGFNDMAGGLGERERLRDLFGRHVGREVAHAALDSGVQLGGEIREVGVLFVDIVGSTELAGERPPAEVVSLLNRFFQVVVEVVERHGGWVNKFEGDAALCVFGAPNEREDPAGDGLAAARELRERLRSGLPELDAGIGVSAGKAVAGNVGAEERYEYTVIGDVVNEAARLCELAKRRPERLLAADAAVERANPVERENWRLGESVTLRGRASETRLASPARAA